MFVRHSSHAYMASAPVKMELGTEAADKLAKAMLAVQATTRLRRHTVDDGFFIESLEEVEWLYKDWKRFALRKNVVEMATGVMIASALQKVSQSIVSDLVTPILQTIWSGNQLENSFVILRGGDSNVTYPTVHAAHEAGAVTLNYGRLIDSLLNFVVVTMTIYLMYKFFKRLAWRVSHELHKLGTSAADAAHDADRALRQQGRGSTTHGVVGIQPHAAAQTTTGSEMSSCL